MNPKFHIHWKYPSALKALKAFSNEETKELLGKFPTEKVRY